MARGLNQGLGFKSPRKQFQTKGGVHCSRDIVVYLTFTIARLTLLTLLGYSYEMKNKDTFFFNMYEYVFTYLFIIKFFIAIYIFVLARWDR